MLTNLGAYNNVSMKWMLTNPRAYNVSMKRTLTNPRADNKMCQ